MIGPVRKENVFAILGGEEYLTFSSCTVNSGSAMDPKSGIFNVPVTGKGRPFFSLSSPFLVTIIDRPFRSLSTAKGGPILSMSQVKAVLSCSMSHILGVLSCLFHLSLFSRLSQVTAVLSGPSHKYRPSFPLPVTSIGRPSISLLSHV